MTVPNAWNVGDDSVASMNGSIGWYRKDFELPTTSAALDWAMRFESVNYRADVWLNGRKVGSHRGAYLPFTVLLKGSIARREPARGARDSRRTATDFPPARDNPTTGLPTGGWWNYGGILREVYLERIDTLPVRVGARDPAARLPRLPGDRADVDAAAQRHQPAAGA